MSPTDPTQSWSCFCFLSFSFSILDLLFYPNDGSSTFLQNASRYITLHNTTSQKTITFNTAISERLFVLHPGSYNFTYRTYPMYTHTIYIFSVPALAFWVTIIIIIMQYSEVNTQTTLNWILLIPAPRKFGSKH